MSRLLIPAQIALIVLLTIAVYAGVRHHHFVWDTIPFVLENPWVHAWTLDNVISMLTEVHRAIWHPVVLLSHTLDISLFGYDSGAHHLVNLGLHCLNAVLVYLLLLRILRTAGYEQNYACWVSFMTALIFAIHPQHVESVAWVVERKDVLYSVFALLSLIAYLRYRDTGLAKRELIPFVLFLISIGAKPMAVSIPVVMLLLDIYPLRRTPTFSDLIRRVVEKSHYFVVIVAVSIFTVYTHSASMTMPSSDLMPLWVRMLNAINNSWFYVAHYLWPTALSPFYPYPHVSEVLSPAFWLPGIAFLVTMSLLVIYLFLRNHHWPMMLFGFYVVTLLPVSGLIHVGPAKGADHYVYLATLPLSLLTAILISRMWLLARFRAVIATLAIAYAGFLVAITHAQVTVWQSEFSLWTRVVHLYPDHPFGHRNLAAVYVDMGYWQEALAHAEKSIELGSPDHAFVEELKAFIKNSDAPAGADEPAPSGHETGPVSQ